MIVEAGVHKMIISLGTMIYHCSHYKSSNDCRNKQRHDDWQIVFVNDGLGFLFFILQSTGAREVRVRVGQLTP